MTHAVMKHLLPLLLVGEAVLIIALKLLMLLLLYGEAVLIIALKILQSWVAAEENSYVFGNVIVPRGIILSMLQIINRTID